MPFDVFAHTLHLSDDAARADHASLCLFATHGAAWYARLISLDISGATCRVLCWRLYILCGRMHHLAWCLVANIIRDWRSLITLGIVSIRMR